MADHYLTAGGDPERRLGDRAISTCIGGALERDDPKLAFQAARLVGLYRRLWESCVSKHLDCEKANETNQVLRDVSMNLSDENEGLQSRHDEQLSRLCFFDQASNSSRERLTGILIDWNQLSRRDLAELLDVDRCE